MYLDCLYNLYTLFNVIKLKSIHYFNGIMIGKNNEVKRIYKDKNNLLSHLENLPKDPTFIIDNLYLGNAHNSSNIKTIKKFGIEKIINATQEIPNSFPNEIEYMRIPIRDTRDNFIEKYLEKSLQFINKHNNKNILVHCYMGSSRSAIIIINYLVFIKNMELKDAIDFLKQKRNLININENFVDDLKKRIINKMKRNK